MFVQTPGQRPDFGHLHQPNAPHDGDCRDHWRAVSTATGTARRLARDTPWALGDSPPGGGRGNLPGRICSLAAGSVHLRAPGGGGRGGGGGGGGGGGAGGVGG